VAAPPYLIGSSVTCIDGSAKGSTKGCHAACEGIFRYNNANFLGGFVVNLHITYCFPSGAPRFDECKGIDKERDRWVNIPRKPKEGQPPRSKGKSILKADVSDEGV
jgi:hypothetical protein